MSARIAVVTGGTVGLGRAIMRELAHWGWDIAILARGEEGLQGAAADVMREGSRALPLSVEVADNTAVEAATGVSIAAAILLLLREVVMPKSMHADAPECLSGEIGGHG
ncbi:SDR family NAD(P)-dependent oxidoreductase [Frondihabitans australicus]|uniref:Short subunit dehydrogenase n=1 Tax=Frondihabitans australicus TaxID=386892 RepID=A0A495IFM0_9MICO|nr:SDR family NAD(P)-dependent oxidoreductase [Frondihabitans australicus]RKR74812.1 short subunit dehydrogenase [Frondihabitans australicus]